MNDLFLSVIAVSVGASAAGLVWALVQKRLEKRVCARWRCRVWTLPEREGHVDLPALMERLGGENIDSVLLEGGGTLNWAALESGTVQKVQAYVASKLFGGTTAKSPIGGLGVGLPDQAVQLKNTMITRIGEDFLLESEVAADVYRDG